MQGAGRSLRCVKRGILEVRFQTRDGMRRSTFRPCRHHFVVKRVAAANEPRQALAPRPEGISGRVFSRGASRHRVLRQGRARPRYSLIQLKLFQQSADRIRLKRRGHLPKVSGQGRFALACAEESSHFGRTRRHAFFDRPAPMAGIARFVEGRRRDKVRIAPIDRTPALRSAKDTRFRGAPT